MLKSDLLWAGSRASFWSAQAMWSIVRSREVRCMVIFEEGLPYLARFYLSERKEKGGKSMFAHCFFRSDAEGFYHNHPWARSRSLIVSIGYIEHVLDDHRVSSKAYMPGDVNVITPDVFHRVELVGPGCWTVMEAEGDVGEWGFVEPGKTFERWDVRNARLKPEKSVEIMGSRDRRLDAYMEESLRRP